MTASEINITIDEAVAKCPNLEEKIRHSVELIRKGEKMALEFDPVNGYHLAFSGGKDSQVLYHITKMAGVRFKAHMNLTSVDPPEVLRFIRREYPDVILHTPPMSIYKLAKERQLLPARNKRWCCAELKERRSDNSVQLLGIRKEESENRKRRNEIEADNHKLSTTLDQWEEHEEVMHQCSVGGDNLLISPIIHWTEQDIWQFMNTNNIPHCSLYDEGFKRIGCILCPMHGYKQKVIEQKRWPHSKRQWIETIQWLMNNKWKNLHFPTAELYFRWWISGKSLEQFKLDEIYQLKIDWNEENNQKSPSPADGGRVEEDAR